jgi:hypothetical protein
LLPQSRWFRFVDFRESLGTPQTSKLLDCRRRVARKVIIGVSVDQHPALPNLVAIIDPTAEFSGAINNGLIPGCRLLFDAFAIT